MRASDTDLPVKIDQSFQAIATIVSSMAFNHRWGKDAWQNQKEYSLHDPILCQNKNQVKVKNIMAMLVVKVSSGG